MRQGNEGGINYYLESDGMVSRTSVYPPSDWFHTRQDVIYSFCVNELTAFRFCTIKNIYQKRAVLGVDPTRDL